MKLKPHLHDGIYVFCKVDTLSAELIQHSVATFRESEETTVILPKEMADERHLHYNYQAAWITLQVDTDLDMVGLTARFSTALADAGISCNVLAAYHHDHIFVNHADAKKALETLDMIDLPI